MAEKDKSKVLCARGIVKNFGGVRALKGVDFEVEHSEIHCLCGENGCGKSTLIKVLTGVEEFESGEIQIEGADTAIINRSPQEAQARGQFC